MDYWSITSRPMRKRMVLFVHDGLSPPENCRREETSPQGWEAKMESRLETLAAERALAAAARFGRSFIDGADDDDGDIEQAELTHPLAVHIAYSSASGELSARVVTVRSVWRKDGLTYMRGRCHVRRQDRTFRLDRVEELICVATGEVPDDPEEWLIACCTAPSLRPDPTAAAIHAKSDELQVLAYIARVDELDPAEVQVMVDFVAADAPLADRSEVAHYIRKLTPTYYDLTDLLRRMRAGDKDRWHELRACALRLMKADGDVTPDEVAAWRELMETAASPAPRITFDSAADKIVAVFEAASQRWATRR